LNQPSTLTDELARFLMIWVGLLGAAGDAANLLI
ncbi:C4-dicarboxylate ABC transporter permease, partial [Salmonella enterica]|nr:C4-dicarboxylate ABC transporter permease [Salmonella enterica]